MSEIKQATIISEFLRYTPLLKKVAVGQYLASGDSSFDVAVRTKYIHLFNLNNKSMLAALRTFLEAFRLPGEAQQIDRLLQAFANETRPPTAYLHTNPHARSTIAMDRCAKKCAYLHTNSHSRSTIGVRRRNARAFRRLA